MVGVLLRDAHQMRHEWHALAAALAASPFLWPGWVLAWHRAFGRGPLKVLVAHRDDELVGVLPVQLRRGTVVSPSNWHTPEFRPLAADDDVATLLLAAALEEGYRRVDLSFVDEGLAETMAAAAEGLGRARIVRVLSDSPYVAVRGTAEEYFAGLSRNLRQDLQRRERRLAELGPVSLRVHTGTEHLEEFLDLEASAWKGAAGTAIAAQEVTRRFYTEVARWSAERGWFRLAFLMVGDTAVAGDLSVEAGGVHHMLKTGYDEQYASYSAGKVLRRKMIERAFDDGLDVYHLGGAREPWKLAWTQDFERRYRVQAFGRSPSGRLDELAYRVGRPAAKTVLAKVRSMRPASP